MLNRAVTFLLIAVVAGILGLAVLVGIAAMIAKVCFIFFLVLCGIFFVRHSRRR